MEPAQALFVAGSPADLPGATSVGMPVFWHNRLGLPLLDSSVHPKFVSESLWPFVEVVFGVETTEDRRAKNLETVKPARLRPHQARPSLCWRATASVLEEHCTAWP